MESSTENITAEDQAAQAREARRKRILENSSKRLEQITGRNAEEFENGKYSWNVHPLAKAI